MRRPITAAIVALTATSTTSFVRASGFNATPTTPELPPISFFWQTNNDQDLNLPRCSPFPIRTSDNPGNPVQPVSPFTLLAAPVGGKPEYIKTDQPLNNTFSYSPAYSYGTQVVLAMMDSRGSSGGAVGMYNMVTTGGSMTGGCAPLSNMTNITFVADPPTNACDSIHLTVTGGQAPYTVNLLAPQSGLWSVLPNMNTNKINYGNTVPAGQNFYIFLRDSEGAVSLVSEAMQSGLNLMSCSEPQNNSDSSGPSVGAIAGGAVGGIVAAIALALIAYYFIKRRRNRETEDRQQQIETETVADYRMADGNAPLVTPFLVMPLESPDGYSPVKSQNGPFGGVYPTTSTSPQTSPIYPSYGGQNPVTGSVSIPVQYGPPDGYPAYETHEGSEDHHGHDAVTLADPDDFEYRTATNYSTPSPHTQRSGPPPPRY